MCHSRPEIRYEDMRCVRYAEISGDANNRYRRIGFPEVSKALRILFLTSVRDTGSCDRNGTIVETPDGSRYMEGVIEHTVRETYAGGTLHGIADVVGVITDDTEKDMRQSDYPVVPQSGKPWIYPLDMKNSTGGLLRLITFHIPSMFRSLPKEAREARRSLKEKFETAVFETMYQLGADVLVTDHYMAKIEFLFPHSLGLQFGRVLNIHPAVTVRGHPFCFRGPTPTADAIRRAQTARERIKTGATLHIINEEIDDGPMIAYCANTPVYVNDEPQWLRYRNYRTAKLPLFIVGLAHYVRFIYPSLGTLDFSQPLCG